MALLLYQQIQRDEHTHTPTYCHLFGCPPKTLKIHENKNTVSKIKNNKTNKLQFNKETTA